jgi:phospholipase C
VAFANQSEVGAMFYVTSMSIPGGPWTYTVEAGRDLSAGWTLNVGSNTTYDLTVHGPNGFLRQFKGSVGSVGAEVVERHAGRSDQLRLALSNEGDVAVRLTVTDAYRQQQPKTYLLRPHAAVSATMGLRGSNDWYDVSIVSADDDSFLRRLAGHMETGRPSTSDPAIASG